MTREFISQLLTALDNPRVQMKIIQIATGEIFAEENTPSYDAGESSLSCASVEKTGSEEEIRAAFEQLQQENGSLTRECDRLTEQTKKAESIILHLESTLEQSEKQRRLADEIIRDFQVSIQQSEKNKQEQENLVEELRSSIRRFEEEQQKKDLLIEELRSSLSESGNERQRTDRLLEELQASLTQAEREKEEAQTALSGLQLSEKQQQNDRLIEELQTSLSQAEREKKIFRDESERLETDNARLYTENHALRGKISAKDNEILSLQDEIQHFKARDQEFQASLLQYKDFAYKQKTAISAYTSHYGNIDKFYQLYRSMDISVQQALYRSLSAENPEQFFACGIQWNSIKALWDFISTKLSVYDKAKIESLTKIWEYFFSLYAQITGEYERLFTNVAQQFDEMLHTRTGDSSTVQMEILEVLLQGYRNRQTQEIKKSVVRT